MKTRNIAIILLLVAFAFNVTPAQDVKTIKSNVLIIKYSHGTKNMRWKLDDAKDIDIDEVPVAEGEKVEVKFTTDVESISFTVELGQKYDFNIEYNGKAYKTQVVGVKPAAQ